MPSDVSSEVVGEGVITHPARDPSRFSGRVVRPRGETVQTIFEKHASLLFLRSDQRGERPEEFSRTAELRGLPLPASDLLRIVKNFFSQSGSSLVAQGFAFFSTAYVARCLSAEGFGWIGLAQGYLAYFTLITDLGLRTIGMREVAAHREDVPRWVGHVLGLRIALASLAMALFLATVVIIPKPADYKSFLAGYGALIYTSALLLDWVFQGMQRMELVALGELIRAGSYLVLVLVGLHHRSQIFRVPTFTFLSQLFPVMLLGGIFWRQFGRVRPTFHWVAWKDLLKQSLPISVGGMTLQLATGLDVVLLGFLRSESEVGYFSAAYRLAFMPTSFTTALGFVMFPVMAHYWKDEPSKLGEIIQALGRVLVLMAVPLVVAGWAFASSLIQLVYGRGFLPATLSFQILLGYLFVAHAYCPFYYLLPACGKEKAFMRGMMSGAAIGAVGMLVLIPHFGATGAASAKVIAHTAVLVTMFRATCREVVRKPLVEDFVASAFLGVPMALLIKLTPAAWPVKLMVGLAAYVISLGVWHRRTGSEIVRVLLAKQRPLEEGR